MVIRSTCKIRYVRYNILQSVCNATYIFVYLMFFWCGFVRTYFLSLFNSFTAMNECDERRVHSAHLHGIQVNRLTNYSHVCKCCNCKMMCVSVFTCHRHRLSATPAMAVLLSVLLMFKWFLLLCIQCNLFVVAILQFTTSPNDFWNTCHVLSNRSREKCVYIRQINAFLLFKSVNMNEMRKIWYGRKK